jgi:hypothetical protein
MRQLLDFLYEYSLDKLIYCVLPSDGGELQLSWRSASPLHWQVQHADVLPPVHVARADLIAHLTERGADLTLFERELSALVSAHIALADQMLTAARRALGSDTVNSLLRGQQHFAGELRQALAGVLTPRLTLVR